MFSPVMFSEHDTNTQPAQLDRPAMPATTTPGLTPEQETYYRLFFSSGISGDGIVLSLVKKPSKCLVKA